MVSAVFLQDDLLAGLNPGQAQAVMAPMDSALRVMAGAGTGKTRIITHRYVKLYQDLQYQNVSAPESRLWVSTFTVKAAEEMKSRIINWLPHLADSARQGNLWIGTFHSLCQRILKENANISPGGVERALLSDLESEALREDLVNQAVEAPPENLAEILARQNLPVAPDILLPETLLAFDLTDSQALVNEIVFDIIPRIKAAGLSPAAFYEETTRQAQSLSALLQTLPVSEINADPWNSHETYAQAWEGYLRPVSADGFSFYPGDWAMEIEAQKARPRKLPSILKDALKPFYDFGCYVSYNGLNRKAPFSAKLRDTGFLTAALEAERQMIGVVAALYAWYQDALLRENAQDYDDLMLEAIRLLETHPGLRARYQERFCHFLVDEFQDSNGLQLGLIQLLQNPQSPALTVVGDIKQSIYRFRFAEPQNLQVLFDPIPEAQTVHLQDNYRSHPDILEMANCITHMMGHDAGHYLQAAAPGSNENAAGVITWKTFDKAEYLQDAKDAEAGWIAETVQMILARQDYRPTDIAVLVPRNLRALEVEEALEAAGIAAVKQRNHGFFSDTVIQQAVWLFTLIENPQDNMAMAALLQSKLSDSQLASVVHHRHPHETWFEAIQQWVANPETCSVALQAVLPLFEALTKTLGELVSAKSHTMPSQLFEMMSGLLPLISPAALQTRRGQKTVRNLDLLRQVIGHWTEQTRTPRDLPAILKLLQRAQAKNDLDVPFETEDIAEEAVRILTIHGAKGLEFPVVFVAGVMPFQGRIPAGLLTVDPQYPGKAGFGLMLNQYEGKKSLKRTLYEAVWHKPREDAEKLRLFYVAVTRAKSRLYLTSWPKSFAYLNPAFFTR